MTQRPGNETIMHRIEEILERHVRPYIEMDGGIVELVRVEDGVAYVRLSGACDTCPSAPLTLKTGVERQIRRRLPEIRAVELTDDSDR